MLARIHVAPAGLMCFGEEGCLTPESPVGVGGTVPCFCLARSVKLCWGEEIEFLLGIQSAGAGWCKKKERASLFWDGV
ncbi:hypothetical protein TNCV_188501 [Trichonephila clavipes]|nr:hypothetical protein TNCV_188501 [Trichonephila clavipes]